MNDPWDADKTRENFASRSNLKELETCSFFLVFRFLGPTFNSIVNRGFFSHDWDSWRGILFSFMLMIFSCLEERGILIKHGLGKKKKVTGDIKLRFLRDGFDAGISGNNLARSEVGFVPSTGRYKCPLIGFETCFERVVEERNRGTEP